MTDLRTAALPQRPAEPVHRSRKMGQDDKPAKVRLSEVLGPNAEDDERDDIIRMAREASSEDGSVVRDDGKTTVLYAAKTSQFLERFAALVASTEREACAKVCYELPWKDMGHIPSNLAFAAAIRARSNT